MICANHKIYAWGNNQGGILGTGLAATVINSPTEVIFPVGIAFSQVHSGSGTHFVALDCNGSVWAWGNNSRGQVGNNTTGNNVTVPVRVKAGVLSGTNYDDGAGNLTGVKIVYGGNENSFAILNDNRLIAWGANNAGSSGYADVFGQLGDGTIISKLTPVFVTSGITGNGQVAGEPLKHVIQVSSGDNVAYALADPDGDGKGIVYSWGNGVVGTLGRNLNGIGNPGTNIVYQSASAGTTIVSSSRAFPVQTSTGDLKDMTQISSGDVCGMALDVNGYIWTWGHGAWNNLTGNTTTNTSSALPARVLKGNTLSLDNDGKYLIARQITGAQGMGMAVTISGRPVVWGGGNTCTDGGIQGTGTDRPLFGIPASYIVRGTTKIIDTNVVSICRGDSWGFYTTSNNNIYTWGCNTDGQLGIGNIVNQYAAVQLIPPSGSDFKDPKPSVALLYDTISLCGHPNGVNLNPGFTISSDLSAFYKVSWTKHPSTVVLQTGDATLVNLTYKTTQTGTYIATISYTGSNADCNGYAPAVSYITVNSCIITDLETGDENNSLEAKLSPNPFKEQIQIDAEAIEKITVLNNSGVLIEEQNPLNKSKVLLGESWNKGLYFIRLTAKGKIQNFKVIKE